MEKSKSILADSMETSAPVKQGRVNDAKRETSGNTKSDAGHEDNRRCGKEDSVGTAPGWTPGRSGRNSGSHSLAGIS